MQYRRTPAASGYSPSELLNNRQLRTKVNTLLPSPVHEAQAKQSRQAAKDDSRKDSTYNIGDPCYALYVGPRRTKDPRWVPAIVQKNGIRNLEVRVLPDGPIWRSHLDQIRPRYAKWGDDETLRGRCCDLPNLNPQLVRLHQRWANYGPRKVLMRPVDSFLVVQPVEKTVCSKSVTPE